MTLKTLIIDDEPIALRKLRSYVEKVPFLSLESSCESAFEAMEYLGSHTVDLIFTDISMPDLDGLGFVRSLPSPPMVVFITAHPDYAVESYSVSALDYLLKPYSMADFQRAANKALLRAEALRVRSAAPRSEAPKSIFVKTDTRHIRLELSDISHIKGYGEYLQIFLADSPTPVVTLSSFAAILGRLPECFVQVHRSYIVNMERVLHVERARISLGPDTYIPVGDSYKAALQDYLARLTAGIR